MSRSLPLLIVLVLAASVATSAQDVATTKPLKVVLAGDSTVTDASGWGKAFAARLGPGVTCVNLARSGRSSRSYRDEGHWKKVLAEKPDYVFIQFGHNDQPGKGPERETDPATTYRAFLREYVDEARAAGATPVLVTSLARRVFRDGKPLDTLGPYAEAARAVAREKHVPLVDLHARSLAAIAELGPAGADVYNPPTRDGAPDRTHLNAEGARATAALVAAETRRAVPALAAHLRDEPRAR